MACQFECVTPVWMHLDVSPSGTGDGGKTLTSPKPELHFRRASAGDLRAGDQQAGAGAARYQYDEAAVERTGAVGPLMVHLKAGAGQSVPAYSWALCTRPFVLQAPDFSSIDFSRVRWH